MRRLIHLSDLHFGRTREDLLEPLGAAINALGPDLVVVSGDFTQRARNHQFAAARAFVDRLAPPWLGVPGNHDVPLDNIGLRLLDPFRRYRRWIDEELTPVWRDPELVVMGLNTVDPLAWQRGRAGRTAISEACAAFRAAPASGEEMRVIVAHHPFEQGPEVAKQPMKGAGRGIASLSDCGVKVVLTGHLHAWGAEPVVAAPGGASPTLLVQAGTGLSTRLRGEENDFNLLTLDHGRVAVERFVAREGAAEFEPQPAVWFDLGDAGWTRRRAKGAP